MGHNGNPNSLRNLERGRWKPGQSGNPTGRAKGVVYPSELLRGLLAMDDDGKPRYTRADLEKIVKDEKSAPALVIAAQSLLDGMMDGKRYILGKDGKPHATTLDPTPARVRVDIADRVEGKCVQSVHVHKTETRPPAEIDVDIVALLAARPELLAQAIASLPPDQRAKLLPVDTDARPIE